MIERLASRISQHQHGLAAFVHKLQRPYGPRVVQVVLKSVFVSKPV
jgi:hypothetical protein